MEAQEQSLRLNRIIEGNRHFENLLSNPDFLQWRESVVEPYLESVLSSISSADRAQEGWEKRVADALVAYQEGKKLYDYLFTMAAANASYARKQLKELQEAGAQPS